MRSIRLRLHIKGDQIGQSVIVDIRRVAPHAGIALMPQRGSDTIGERPIPIIQPQEVIPDIVVTDIDIRTAITVKIAHYNPQAVAILDDSGLAGSHL